MRSKLQKVYSQGIGVAMICDWRSWCLVVSANAQVSTMCVLLLLLLLKSIFKCRAVKKKLLEHFTEVKHLMTMCIILLFSCFKLAA